MVDCYLGEIRLWPGNRIPDNWHQCDGTLLPISSNQALYAVIGTRYGGDGVNTFGVPDLRGRIPVGTGTYPGGATYAIGQTGGAATVTLTEAQLPAHTHTMMASSTAATTINPTGAALADPTDNFNLYVPVTATATTFSLAANAIGATGGSQSHPNMMPSLAIQYIIALVGLYPTPQ